MLSEPKLLKTPNSFGSRGIHPLEVTVLEIKTKKNVSVYSLILKTQTHCNLIFFFFGLFAFSRAAPAAYGGSQARGRMRAVATGLCHSHSNAGSEARLQCTPQLTATPDP